MPFYSSSYSSYCRRWTLNLKSCSVRLRRTRSFGCSTNATVFFLFQHTVNIACTVFYYFDNIQLSFVVSISAKGKYSIHTTVQIIANCFTLFFLSLTFFFVEKVLGHWLVEDRLVWGHCIVCVRSPNCFKFTFAVPDCFFFKLRRRVHCTKWFYKQIICQMAYFTMYTFIFSYGQLFFRVMESPGSWLWQSNPLNSQQRLANVKLILFDISSHCNFT